MNRKEATMIAIVATALLATIMTATSSTPAFALGHWNLDEDYVPAAGMANSDTESTDDGEESSDEDSDTAASDDEEESSDEDSDTAASDDEDRESSDDTDSSNGEDSTDAAYEELQACLSDSDGEGSPSEQEVQDCIDSSYSGKDSAEDTPTDNTDEVEEDENGATEDVSTDDSEDDEENEDNGE
ncbi:MAG: hypothetical protein WBL49_04955 [Nitrososphaeraceae archaeon]